MYKRGLVLFGVCSLWVLGAVLSAQQPHRGDLRLLDAVKRRDQKAFTTLLRAKADVNAAQPDGATALAWAVYLGQDTMAEALLNAGAKANTTDEYGKRPSRSRRRTAMPTWCSVSLRPAATRARRGGTESRRS